MGEVKDQGYVVGEHGGTDSETIADIKIIKPVKPYTLREILTYLNIQRWPGYNMRSH